MKTILLTFAIFYLCIGSSLARPSHDDKRLIKLSDTDKGQWVDEATILSLKQQKVNFMDITGRKFPIRSHISPNEIPDKIQFEFVVNNAISHISSERTKSFLTEFNNYFNRFYSTEFGKDSALWLLSEVEKSIAESGYSGTVSVETFAHTWLQPSIIARIEGSDPELKNEVVILGAHLDSMNLFGGSTLKAPGADDNGSGSSVLLEAFRVLLESDFIPKRTIEFQWYAAEEIGLRGSGDIAETYFQDSVNIISMINFDVVGYFEGRREIGIITDNTNAKLSQFLRIVVDAYVDFKWINKRCGYACSDHASFNSFGFPASFPVEVVFHPDMHTARDTVDKINFEQVKEFTKLALGYAIEIGVPAS